MKAKALPILTYIIFDMYTVLWLLAYISFHTHTCLHFTISLSFYMDALTQKYHWQIKYMLKCLFSIAVYKGGSVCCDVKFKLFITSDNLYIVFQNCTCFSVPLCSAVLREKV
jgi:hypothetical protein